MIFLTSFEMTFSHLCFRRWLVGGEAANHLLLSACISRCHTERSEESENIYRTIVKKIEKSKKELWLSHK